MKSMLITGATGTVGGELVRRYHGRYRVLAQGRDAVALAGLHDRYPSVRTVEGDLHSRALAEAIGDSEVVIHAAAQKYAGIAERHCAYTLETNLLATARLAALAAEAGVETFLFVSADAAAVPSDVCGMSKYLAERVVLELSGAGHDTRFTVCRLGRLARPGAPADPDAACTPCSLEEAGDLIGLALDHTGNGDVVAAVGWAAGRCDPVEWRRWFDSVCRAA